MLTTGTIIALFPLPNEDAYSHFEKENPTSKDKNKKHLQKAKKKQKKNKQVPLAL